MLKSVVLASLAVSTVLAVPVATPLKRWTYAKCVPALKVSDLLLTLFYRYFDLQGHRGGRGEHIENTLDSFAWGIIDGMETVPCLECSSLLIRVYRCHLFGDGCRSYCQLQSLEHAQQDRADCLHDPRFQKDGHLVVWHDEVSSQIARSRFRC
jgi:hypothetical protein